jgi:hypothetical protein
MNAFKEIVKEKNDDGTEREVVKIRYKKNTKPKANKQGVEDIISYVEKLVNSHTVQGNTDSLNEHRDRLRAISNDITMHFMVKRIDWGIDINDIDSISSNAINLLDIFLSRTLFNKEREGYGEGFKETTSREVRPEARPNWAQRFGSFIWGKGRR